MRVNFSKNLHDSVGDVYNECILLHFEESFIIKLKDLNDLDELIQHLELIKKEIKENE